MSRWILLAILLISTSPVLARDEGGGEEEAAPAELLPEEGEAEDSVETRSLGSMAVDERLEPSKVEPGSDADAAAAAAAAAQRREVERDAYNALIEKKRKMERLMLGVLALLLLWLLSRRTSAQTLTEQRRAERRAPVSPQELARAVFEVARDGSLEGYRGLFLNGGEAARVLGREGAERYLSQRSKKALEDALVNMAVQVPPNAVFMGVESVSEDSFAMKLGVDAKTTALVPIGRAVQVGAIYRLADFPR